MESPSKKGYNAPIRGRSSSTFKWAAGGAGICALIGHAIDRKSGAAWGGAIGGFLGGLIGSEIDSGAGR